jgi:hypothetical protein
MNDFREDEPIKYPAAHVFFTEGKWNVVEHCRGGLILCTSGALDVTSI